MEYNYANHVAVCDIKIQRSLNKMDYTRAYSNLLRGLEYKLYSRSRQVFTYDSPPSPEAREEGRLSAGSYHSPFLGTQLSGYRILNQKCSDQNEGYGMSLVASSGFEGATRDGGGHGGVGIPSTTKTMIAVDFL